MKLEIEVSDDGVGLPEGFSFESNDSLGVYLGSSANRTA